MNKGFSILETTVAVALIAILTFLTFPLIRTTTTINKTFHSSDKQYKKINRVITSMERTITNSKKINIFYSGKENLESSFFIADYSENIKNTLSSSLFSSKINRGNLLFLEYPSYDNKSIIYGYVIFFFSEKNLYFIEAKLLNSTIQITKKQAIIKNVDGYFEQASQGVIITINSENNILKGFGYIEN